MAKHTQTICRLLPTSCWRVFDHFVGLALKGLNCYYLLTSDFLVFSFMRVTYTFCGLLIKLIKGHGCHYIETNLLIFRANQLTSFYMMTTMAFNELMKTS